MTKTLGSRVFTVEKKNVASMRLQNSFVYCRSHVAVERNSSARKCKESFKIIKQLANSNINVHSIPHTSGLKMNKKNLETVPLTNGSRFLLDKCG